MNLKKAALAAGVFGSLALGLPMPVQAADYAFVLRTLSNPYWVSMKEGVLAEAKKRGVEVDVLAAAGEDDLSGQQHVLEDVVNKNYKAVAVAPITPTNLVQAMAAATRKGIYVVNVDASVNMGQLKTAGGSVVAFIATDNLALGEKAGKFLLEKMGPAGGKVAIIEGKAGNSTGDARRDGVKRALGAAGNVKLVASLPADWDRAKALDAASAVMQRNPDLRAFYAANDTMALGVLQAVKNANKLGKILVIGTDGTPEARNSVKQGELTATAAQDPAGMGALALDVMISALKDRPPISVDSEPKQMPMGSEIIAPK